METNADAVMIPSILRLYEKIATPGSPIRRINISCNHVVPETCLQYSLFDSPKSLERARKLQQAVLEIRDKYGKGAVMKGVDLLEDATARQRSQQIGGHRRGE